MTSTELNPAEFRTPKTNRRNRRGIELPATVTGNDDGTETVNRIVRSGYQGPLAVYEPSYTVGAGWGRVAVEQEIEAVDARSRRKWTVQACAEAAILRIPGYTEQVGR